MTDIQLTITPDAMKAASKALRALVREKTGQDIAHSSVLNALTQGLGLGQNFGAMLAAQKKPAPRPHDTTTVLLVFDLEEHEMKDHDSVDAALEAVMYKICDGNPAWDVSWSIHDRYVVGSGSEAALWVSHPGLATLPKNKIDGHWLCSTIFEGQGGLDVLAPFLDRPHAMACAFHSGGDVRELSVDFRYRSTGQICTASVQENVWKAAHDAGLDLDDVLRIVGYDCEIADEAIEVLDTRVDFGTIWNA